MNPLIPSTLTLDKTAFSSVQSFDDTDDNAYWFSRTPSERLQQMERLRRINYGHHATARLQSVLEIAQSSWG